MSNFDNHQEHVEQGNSARQELIQKFAAAVGSKEYDLIHEFDNLIYKLQYHAKMEGVSLAAAKVTNIYHHEHNPNYNPKSG